MSKINSGKPEIFNFAYFPKYDEAIKFLGEKLADPEEWDFSTTINKTFSILKNYVNFTYLKLYQENKISFTKDNKFASFNTGLITSNLEDIFAFFEEYKNPRNSNTPRFCFKAFIKKSDNLLLKYFSNNLPEIADYFSTPELLIFNPRLELIPDIDHIIKDNKDRFPHSLQSAGDDEIRRQLNGAIEDVKKKVRTNYKLAVPQYYKGKIQLLLPLCLTPGSPNPDLALVVHKINDKTYTARTCLTLTMAYNNARLIAKPQSNWLRP